MNLLKHKNDIFTTQSAGSWGGLIKLPCVERVAPPCHRWFGPPIPMALVWQILAFFRWSFAETKSESVVTLMLHESGTWGAAVFPQEAAGMTVKLLPDHENRVPTFERFGKGWEMMGTWHHHCAAGAFQSGTDSADEATKEGIHLTSGNLNDKEWSLHARASFRKVMTPVGLEDWFECADSVAPHLRSDQIEWALTQPPPEDTVFPDWWKDNVFRPAPVVYSRTHYQIQERPSHPSQGEWQLWRGQWGSKKLPGEKFMICLEEAVAKEELTLEDIMEFFRSVDNTTISCIRLMTDSDISFGDAESVFSTRLFAETGQELHSLTDEVEAIDADQEAQRMAGVAD